MPNMIRLISYAYHLYPFFGIRPADWLNKNAEKIFQTRKTIVRCMVNQYIIIIIIILYSFVMQMQIAVNLSIQTCFGRNSITYDLLCSRRRQLNYFISTLLIFLYLLQLKRRIHKIEIGSATVAVVHVILWQ